MFNKKKEKKPLAQVTDAAKALLANKRSGIALSALQAGNDIQISVIMNDISANSLCNVIMALIKNIENAAGFPQEAREALGAELLKKADKDIKKIDLHKYL